MKMNYGAGPEGVPNPLNFIVHPYPTRYHGPIYDRPMWGAKTFMQNPYNFAAGPDGSLSGCGAVDDFGFQDMATDLRSNMEDAAQELCAPVCQQVGYQWGAVGLLSGGGVAWLAWTLKSGR